MSIFHLFSFYGFHYEIPNFNVLILYVLNMGLIIDMSIFFFFFNITSIHVIILIVSTFSINHLKIMTKMSMTKITHLKC
jgi:hypothetical protein